MNTGFTGFPAVMSAAPLPYINIQDQKTSGTVGGTFTSGAWQTRTLNTIVNDTANLAVLASNQITLPAGNYRIAAICPAFKVSLHQSRLQNITAGTTLLWGTSEYTETTTNSQSHSLIRGQFTLTAPSTIALQHQCTATSASQGFGTAASLGTEVYAICELWKVG